MDFDHTYNNGAVDWNFPSPNATPTTGSFNQNGFQTPKTATFSSHFNDAFSTPQMPGYATPRQPDYSTMTPMQGPQSSSEALRNSYYGNMQNMGGPVHPGQAMPPPTYTPQQYQGQMVSPVYAHGQGPPMQMGHAMSFDTAQMQTPPPTRGTSVKRPTPAQPVAFGTPSTIAARRFATPQQASTSQAQPQPQGPQYTPVQFPQLQFTPDVYQFGNMGPASAPVYPQTQLLWEQSGSPVMYTQQNTLDDPFAPATSTSMGWPTTTAQQGYAPVAAFNTPAMNGFQSGPPTQRPASAVGIATSKPHLSPPVMTSAGIDPSMVYSSPIRPAMPSSIRSEKATSRPPPKIEPKRKDSAAPEHKRTDTASSAEAVVTPAPKGLRRSNTTGTAPARPQSAHPSIGGDSLSRSNSVLHPPRTASPLKRVGKMPLGSISERKPNLRRSVILTVDETGRAGTEIQGGNDSPTKSIRERYPGLFDSDSSDEESEEEDKSPSRSASFSFSKGEERKSKAAKPDPPVENLEGLSIPRSSSSASMKVTPSRAAIAAAAQPRRSGSVRKQTPSRNNSQRRTPASATKSIDTAPMDMQPDLRQSRAGADNDLNDFNDGSLAAHNRRWSMMSMEQQNISPVHQTPDSQYAPPSARRLVQQGRQIRCNCGQTHEQGQMVQCISCTQWSHAGCVTLNPAALPPNFTCFLCTRPTSGFSISRPGQAGSRKRS